MIYLHVQIGLLISGDFRKRNHDVSGHSRPIKGTLTAFIPFIAIA